ncbi:hypothetical protein [Streptomyces chartreusis]|uniref:hypothetical protein n=1 Tax=Streptomyces chartreusis TaxID=1969 RepID=UPI00362E1389
MGNRSRPGSIVIREIPHPEFTVDGEKFRVHELVWNGIAGRSFDVVRCDGDEVLTDESFDNYPTDLQIAAVLKDHGVYIAWTMCAFCHKDIPEDLARSGFGGLVGDCHSDERLR